MVTCPACDADIDVDESELDEGDSLSCDECGATLNVVSLDPLELESDDDLDDDDEDEDEDEEYMDDEEDEDEDDDEEEDW
ncbi:MAG: hypothetical protein R2729_11585 [Bryobacteraceae bacterium]